ncbi:MAG: hypothetical protein AAF602_18725 [Myxococcota bacterium]
MSERHAVVASPRGTSLYIAAGLPRTVDHDAVAKVLAKHGQTYSRLTAQRSLEFVAAMGRSEDQAVALADDLRAAGLHAQVVPAPEASGRSGRIWGAALLSALALLPGAASGLIGLAMFTVIPGVAGQIDNGRSLTEWLVTTGLLVAVSVLLTGLPLANLRALAARGTLAPAGGPLQDTDPEAALMAIREVADGLPDPLGARLVERAEGVAAAARLDPKGPEARELLAILSELREVEASNAGEAVRSLRRDVAGARAAVRETGGSTT